MGLFDFKNKKQEEELVEEEAPQRKINPSTMIMIRLLAAGYLLWMLKDMVQLYIEGGENAPSLWLLIATCVLFVGGAAWIVIISIKQYKRIQAEQAEEAAQAALQEKETAGAEPDGEAQEPYEVCEEEEE